MALLPLKASKILLKEGFTGLWTRVKERCRSNKHWIKLYIPSAERLARMKEEEEAFLYRPLVSIILPVYETPAAFLRAAVESVCSQVYPHWELCIADDASKSPHVRAILEEYEAKDQRIKAVFRGENGHIAECSNSALKLAGGEFMCLLDHDDELAPHALHEAVKALNANPELDMLYSNEAKIDELGNFRELALKAAWAPDYFMSFMYIGHLSVYRTELVRRVGGFRKGYEGSQDYDLALRVTEISRAPQHIAQVLYYWRMHSDSVAQNIDCKPYAFQAASRALNDALKRRGYPEAKAVSTSYRGISRVIYPKETKCSVSVMIYGGRKKNALEYASALETLLGRDYNLQLIIEEDNSGDQVQRLGPEVYLVPRRLGFGALMQIAGQLSDGKYVLLMEAYAKAAHDDWFSALAEHISRPDVAMVGPKLVDRRGLIAAAGYSLRQGKLYANFAGQSSEGPGEAARLVAMNNFTFLPSVCLLLKGKIFRDFLSRTVRYHAQAAFDLALGLYIKQQSLYALWTPYAEIAISDGAVPAVLELESLGADFQQLKKNYSIHNFIDPYDVIGAAPGRALFELNNR